VLGNLLCGLRQPIPGGTRQRPAEADATYAQIGGLRHGDPITCYQQIHGLGRNRPYDRGDVPVLADARRVKAICAGRGIGFKTLDRLLDVGPRDKKALRPPGQ